MVKRRVCEGGRSPGFHVDLRHEPCASFKTRRDESSCHGDDLIDVAQSLCFAVAIRDDSAKILPNIRSPESRSRANPDWYPNGNDEHEHMDKDWNRGNDHHSISRER